MWGIEQQASLHSLSNPFTRGWDRSPVISGHISCRSTEIHDIITGEQNALILAGRPNIGKSTLLRYLQIPPNASWSWRDELKESSHDPKRLATTHFEQIDLRPLLAGDEGKLLDIFIAECTRALYRAYKPEETFTFSDLTLRGLYKLLTIMSTDADKDSRYFLILDNIERLGEMYMQITKNKKSETKKPLEYAITLLDRCRAIRTAVDLINEFEIFGFILSIESFPTAKFVDQFTYISADLARFTTKTLQVFTLSDTRKFLAQPIKNFKSEMSNSRNDNDLSDNNPLFSIDEQSWLLELAGTHPYLLQQCCYYLFQFKAYSANEASIQDSDKEQLLSIIYEQISTFLSRTWKRLQEAMNKSSNMEQVDEKFQNFIAHCVRKKAEDKIELPVWNNLDLELRYILYSEGIVRHDLFRPVYFPGTILRDYLVQQVERNKVSTTQGILSPGEHGHWLHIVRPNVETKHVALSRLEYRLLKTLLQHADSCTEQELIQGAWDRGTERANFTQRLYKLRKKLEESLDGIDIIGNRYGGIYSLTHADWLELD